MKKLEFVRFRKDKDDPQQFPVFKSGKKIVYEVRTVPPTTEKEIVAEWKLLKRIEKSNDWTASVFEVISVRRDILLHALMELKIKESENERTANASTEL